MDKKAIEKKIIVSNIITWGVIGIVLVVDMIGATLWIIEKWPEIITGK